MEILASDGGYPEGAMCAIKPTTSPDPFLVWCPLNGHITSSLIYRVQADNGWSQIEWKSFKWDQYKNGMGSYKGLNFFVGLENLRYILSQAEYRLNMYNIYYDPKPAEPILQPSFRNITLRDEASRYAMSYSVYSTSTPSIVLDLDPFQGEGVLHPFCTVDNDCGTCAKDQGPGWYYTAGGGCVGSSPFAIKAQWPYDDQGIFTIDSTEYSFERIGDFY